MNGEMVATSSSASREVALEKKVTVEDGKGGRLRLAQRKREEYHTATDSASGALHPDP